MVSAYLYIIMQHKHNIMYNNNINNMYMSERALTLIMPKADAAA